MTECHQAGPLFYSVLVGSADRPSPSSHVRPLLKWTWDETYDEAGDASAEWFLLLAKRSCQAYEKPKGAVPQTSAETSLVEKTPRHRGCHQTQEIENGSFVCRVANVTKVPSDGKLDAACLSALFDRHRAMDDIPAEHGTFLKDRRDV